MGCMKNYLLKLQEHCSEESFGQEAIEHAIISGAVTLTYNLDADVRAIMPRYSEFITAYQCECRAQESALVEVYHTSGLLQEILRPVPLTA